MDVHRVGGIKFNFERLTTPELENIHGHLLAQHRQVTDEIELVESKLFARHHEELPFEPSINNYERALGHACLAGEISAQEAYDAHGRFEG